MVKVSIIMPSLNVGEYIEESLNSAINQTLKDIEIICIDAGSTDGTWETIQSKAEKDSRIVALQSPVKSYGFQVNMGLEMAHGEYIGILETDDFISENMYEDLYKFAIERDLDYVKSDYSTYTTKTDGGRDFVERRISVNHRLYDDVFSPSENPHTVVDDWYLWNGIYDAKFLRKYRIRFAETRGAAFQDIGFLYRVSVFASRAQYLNESLYKYCVDREGASSNSKNTLEFIRKEYGILVDEFDESSDGKAKKLLYMRMARSFVRACMETDDEVLKNDKQAEICFWFQRKIREAERWGYVSEKDIPVGLRQGYRHLLNPVEGFMAYRRLRNTEMMDYLSNASVIVIFGCGVYGREAHALINQMGYAVTYYMDNDKRLWKTNVDGIAVLDPDKINELPEDTRYIVANEKYSNEISEQIQEYRPNAMIFEYTSELIYTDDYKKRRR